MFQRKSFRFIILPLFIACLGSAKLFSAAHTAAAADADQEQTLRARLSASGVRLSAEEIRYDTCHYLAFDTNPYPIMFFGTMTALTPDAHATIKKAFLDATSLDKARHFVKSFCNDYLTITVLPASDMVELCHYTTLAAEPEIIYLSLSVFVKHFAPLTRNDHLVDITELFTVAYLSGKECGMQGLYYRLNKYFFAEPAVLPTPELASMPCGGDAVGGCGAPQRAQRLPSAETVDGIDDTPGSPAGRKCAISPMLVSPH